MSVSDYSSMAWVYAIVLKYVPEKTALGLYRTIDRENETGTLYPKVNITIMPSWRAYSDEIIRHHFDDVIKAQNEYVRAKSIIFDMRNYGYVNNNDEMTLSMISRCESLMNFKGNGGQIYVLLSSDRIERVKDIEFEYAGKEETETLMCKNI